MYYNEILDLKYVATKLKKCLWKTILFVYSLVNQTIMFMQWLKMYTIKEVACVISSILGYFQLLGGIELNQLWRWNFTTFISNQFVRCPDIWTQLVSVYAYYNVREWIIIKAKEKHGLLFCIPFNCLNSKRSYIWIT